MARRDFGVEEERQSEYCMFEGEDISRGGFELGRLKMSQSGWAVWPMAGEVFTVVR